MVEALQQTQPALLAVEAAHGEGHGGVLLVDLAEDAAAGFQLELVLLVQSALVHCGLFLVLHLCPALSRAHLRNNRH